ncbi:hypothetical protein AXF42_Ash019505 [Apostasia shenzhenica]|uniref:Uncharacterized protein n=1 Tax=Apostasia shenzhenica TaxID=1088818 RepID=A0A2I0A0A9_9ASPA|nr:hypothetical protein AXF42_Ash019505 [Apostasia shenzhenica]
MQNHLMELEANKGAHSNTLKKQRDGSYESIFQEEASEWSMVLEEANELVGLHKKAHNIINTSNVREFRRCYGGQRGRAKAKFAVRSQLKNYDFSSSCILNNEDRNSEEDDIEGPVNWDIHKLVNLENPVVQRLEKDIQEEITKLVDKPVICEDQDGAPSIVDRLEDLQKSKDPSIGKTMVIENIKGQELEVSCSKRMLFDLGDGMLDDEDSPEFSGSDTSCEDELSNCQEHRSLTTQSAKGQTMTDLLQEAFNKFMEERGALPRRKQSGFGYHGRLQQVMQLEKDGHMKYLKQLHNSLSESEFIDVTVLSRVLEAKLTVCQCLLGENITRLKYDDNQKNIFGQGTMKKTIIFSQKICSNVELEIGNLVRVYSPWKEVHVNGEETIMLCTYFSVGHTQSCGQLSASKQLDAIAWTNDRR